MENTRSRPRPSDVGRPGIPQGTKGSGRRKLCRPRKTPRRPGKGRTRDRASDKAGRGTGGHEGPRPGRDPLSPRFPATRGEVTHVPDHPSQARDRAVRFDPDATTRPDRPRALPLDGGHRSPRPRAGTDRSPRDLQGTTRRSPRRRRKPRRSPRPRIQARPEPELSGRARTSGKTRPRDHWRPHRTVLPAQPGSLRRPVDDPERKGSHPAPGPEFRSPQRPTTTTTPLADRPRRGWDRPGASLIASSRADAFHATKHHIPVIKRKYILVKTR